MTTLTHPNGKIEELLGDKAELLLGFSNPKIPKSRLHLPGPDWVDRIFSGSDRNNRVLVNLQRLFDHGRLTHTGYMSILPVDQGIEHSAGASFAKNPEYFDPENIVKLAIEGGCNAVASTFGVLGLVSRKYAHKIPFIVKINHNELLTYPNKFDQLLFGTVQECYNMGAAAVGATIYFGSAESGRQIVEISQAFAHAHELGMATVLWCYLRNSEFKRDKDYALSSDLTGQANHIGATIQADILKQKLPENNGGFKALNMGGSSYGKLDERMYTELNSDNPIDLTRYQVLNGYAGRIGLINSGGASGKNDFGEAAITAVINKRAGASASSPAARPSSAPWPKASSCSTPSRTCISRPTSPSRNGRLKPPAPLPATGTGEPDRRMTSAASGARRRCHSSGFHCHTHTRSVPLSHTALLRQSLLQRLAGPLAAAQNVDGAGHGQHDKAQERQLNERTLKQRGIGLQPGAFGGDDQHAPDGGNGADYQEGLGHQRVALQRQRHGVHDLHRHHH